MGGGFRLDNRQRSSDNLRTLFAILFSGYEKAKPPLKKMAPKRKCKFNDDWRRDFAWIAKLPDIGMAQCNLCVMDFSISGVWWSHGYSPTPRVCIPW